MLRFPKHAALAITAMAIAQIVSAGQSQAVSMRVKIACASDYYAYCSQHAPGSRGVRRCMKSNGSKLSKRCVNALIGAGEISSKYVAKRRASRKTASR